MPRLKLVDRKIMQQLVRIIYITWKNNINLHNMQVSYFITDAAYRNFLIWQLGAE